MCLDSTIGSKLGSILGSISVETFLKEYWQKKPLLIRNAFPDFEDPLSPEELAGLACEDEAESRLVFTEKDKWSLKSGPFKEDDFTSLPDHNWTLLVQAVDHWFPAVKELIKSANFIPSWRVDDVMVSYAEKDAGVGPHFDYYDVFIIQGQGSRTWRIGQQCNSQSELETSSGLKMLKHFQEQEKWKLQSGDVLYIPPGLAHYGCSENSSLSYSIGFRAPSAEEVVLNYSDEICAGLSEDQRFIDPPLKSSTNQGEISQDALEQAKALLLSSFDNNKTLPTWFGKYMTQPKQEGNIEAPEQVITAKELLNSFAAGEILSKHPSSRVAFIQNKKVFSLFADGEAFSFKHPSKLLLSFNTLINTQNNEPLDLSPFLENIEILNIIIDLYNQGSLISFNDEEEHE